MTSKPRRFTGLLAVLVVVVALLASVAVWRSATSAAVRRVAAVRPVSISLDGGWRFRADRRDRGVELGWQGLATPATSWQTVQVPHTWGVMPKLRDYSGTAWYRRSFVLPDSVRNGDVRLRFEAVFYEAKVWVNGTFVGQHGGGYTPFELDVTKISRPGRNVVAVRVDNRRAEDRIPAQISAGWSFDWWNYGGIVRDASVLVTSKAYIARQRIVATPHLDGVDSADRASITTSVTVVNTGDAPMTETVSGRVTADGSTAVLARTKGQKVSVPARSSRTVDLTLKLDAPRLWHFDHPDLYTLTSRLVHGDTELSTRQDTFGIRLVELKDNRFYLNGEAVRLVGFSRHEDSPQNGLAESTQVMLTDYRDLKRLNEVFTRPVHYPQAPTILDFCDRNGILLVPEVPAWQLTRTQMASAQMRRLERRQLREMVTSEWNHPSIWGWSVGNELDSQSAEAYAFVKEMIKTVKALDPTRPVGFASNHLNTSPERDATRFSDFVEMNQYFGSWSGPESQLSSALDAVHAAFPKRTMFISEWGLEPHWYSLFGQSSSSLSHKDQYFVAETVAASSEKADAERRRLIADQMAVFRSKRYLSGVVFWSYKDYRTPTGFLMGVRDFAGRARGSWQLLREEYSPVRTLSVGLAARTGAKQIASVSIRTRDDLPSYTLRGYVLRWQTMSVGGKKFAAGRVTLPTLVPGSRWSGKATMSVPVGSYRVVVSIVRPTGFDVTRQTYAGDGTPTSRD